MTHDEMIEKAHSLMCEYVYLENEDSRKLTEISDLIKQARIIFGMEGKNESH